MEYLRQQVSIEIQRGNAAAVIGTVENSKESIFTVLNLSFSFYYPFLYSYVS